MNTPIWKQTFNGYGWEQMPGSDVEMRRLNFALYRWGILKLDEVDVDPVEEEDEEKASSAAYKPVKRKKLVNAAQRCRTFAWKPQDPNKPKPEPPARKYTPKVYADGYPAHMTKQCDTQEVIALIVRIKKLIPYSGMSQNKFCAVNGVTKRALSITQAHEVGFGTLKTLRHLETILEEKRKSCALGVDA